MEWYQNKNPTLPEAVNWKEFRYVVFDEHEVELTTRATLRDATLVNITYPHRVINASKERRFCFSICSEENLTWEEITELCYKHGLVRE